MEPIEDIVGMGPLSDFELDGYLSLMDQLKSFKDSIRNFDQFPKDRLNILKERGRTRKIFLCSSKEALKEILAQAEQKTSN